MIRITMILVLASYVCSYATTNRILAEVLQNETDMNKMYSIWHYAHNKPSDPHSLENKERVSIFKQNIDMIKEENSKNLGYTLGLGPFADMTQEEIISVFTQNQVNENDPAKKRLNNMIDDVFGKPYVRPVKPSSEVSSSKSEKKEEPEVMKFNSPDWTWAMQKYSRVQGSCGSCWAQTAAQLVETIATIKYKPKENYYLSAQQLVDCVDPTFGCNEGGNTGTTFNWIMKNGLVQEDEYPYTRKMGKCNTSIINKKGSLKFIIKEWSSCYYLSSDPKHECTEKKIDEYLSKGPYKASVAFSVQDFKFAHYKEGHYRFTQICEGNFSSNYSNFGKFTNQINHAVLVVAWNKKDNIVKIRNSWGTIWGDMGFGYIHLNKEGLPGCGLLEWAYSIQDVEMIK